MCSGCPIYLTTLLVQKSEQKSECVTLITKERLEIQYHHPALDLAVLNLMRVQNQFFLLLVVQSVFMFTTIYFQEKLKKTENIHSLRIVQMASHLGSKVNSRSQRTRIFVLNKHSYMRECIGVLFSSSLMICFLFRQ